MTQNIFDATVAVTKQISAEWDNIRDAVREQDAESIREALTAIDALDQIVDLLKEWQ